jgi:hypothetical protein
MKNCFNAHELPHRWAHQLPGRETSNSNVHRSGNGNGDTLFSYGTAIGEIIEVKRKRVYIISTRGYSSTTSGHQCSMRGAIPNGEIVIEVHGRFGGRCLFESNHPKDWANYVLHYHIDEAASFALKAKRARRFPEWHLRTMRHHIEQAELVKKLFGLRTKIPNEPEGLAEACAKATAKSEAQRRKQQREADKRKDEYEKKCRAELDEAIPRWRNGEIIRLPHEFLLGQCLLRSVTDTDGMHFVETSRHVTVSYDDAKKAYRFCKIMQAKGWRRNGEKFAIGDYQLDSVGEDGVVAGCHRFSWSELDGFAAREGWME